MRVAVSWLLLVGLVSAAVFLGRPGVALGIAGAKALLVGAEFMELKHAARAHAGLFGALVLGLAGVLALLIAR